MKITFKTNGYEMTKSLAKMVRNFNKVADHFFPDWECEHFLYGENLVMTRLYGGIEHADFNITKNRVSFNGHYLSMANVEKCGAMTYHDECFDGHLLEIAGKLMREADEI